MSQAAHKQSFCVVSAGFLFTADWGSIRNWKFVLPAAIVAFSLLIFCATALSQEPPSTNTPTGGIWMVQLGSFDDEQNALWLAERLETFGFTAQISAYATNGRTIFRVRVGPALNRENAVAIAEFLTAHNLPARLGAAPDERLEAIPWSQMPTLGVRRGIAEELDNDLRLAVTELKVRDDWYVDHMALFEDLNKAIKYRYEMIEKAVEAERQSQHMQRAIEERMAEAIEARASEMAEEGVSEEE